ncbi:hypothetical protein [Reticulibacter mediterranei]|nr:hypothetical protein [Reticulibacter mediterranei]
MAGAKACPRPAARTDAPGEPGEDKPSPLPYPIIPPQDVLVASTKEV